MHDETVKAAVATAAAAFADYKRARVASKQARHLAAIMCYEAHELGASYNDLARALKMSKTSAIRLVGEGRQRKGGG